MFQRASMRLLLLLLAGIATATAFALPAAAEEDGYRFSINWTKSNARVWSTVLRPFKGKPGMQGLEVGCFEGRSTLWFLRNVLTAPDSHMTCIDVFTDEIEANFDHNIALSGLGDRVTKKKGYSQDVLRKLPIDGYDFIYIDGCHLASCALTDMVMSWDLLKAGGVMIIDDYAWNLAKPATERPKLAVDAFIEAFSKQLDVQALARQVVLRKRRNDPHTARVGKPVVHDDDWQKAKGAKPGPE